MKKTLVLICVLAIAALLVIGGCKKKEEVTTPTTPTPTTPTEEVTPAPTTPTPTETPQVTETGEVQYGTRGILSDVKCEGKTISAIITNLKDKKMTALPKNAKSDLHIQVNGVNMQEFVCDKTEIGPNEYTYCSDLIGNEARKNLMVRTDRANEVAVWFMDDKANRGVVQVSCS